MFKVECVGCQAPYQVDEKRVPEKGLKMRCPKCGTTFKVEAPASASTAAPPSAELQASDEGVAALPAPLSKPFASAVPLPRKPLPRPGGGRDSLSRTMIGVSSADLGLSAASAEADAARKGFRVPRPNAGAPASTPGGMPQSAASAALGPPAAAPQPLKAVPGLELAPSGSAGNADRADLPAVLGLNELPRGSARDEADLPAVLGLDEAVAPPTRAQGTDTAPASEGAPVEEVTPASLAEPSARLTLSELPPPVTASTPAAASVEPPPATADEAEAAPLELDFNDDLPMAASRVRRPPPRRPRPPAPGAAPIPETAELPARLEDLEAALPAPVNPKPRPAAPGPAPGRAKKSSLDELDLPTIAGRETGASLPAPRAPRKIPAQAGPAAKATAAGTPTAVDLPAVAARAAQARPQRPRVSDLPDVLAPPAAAADAGLPEILGAGLPEVSGSGLPALLAPDLPSVAAVGLPDVAAGLPVVSAGLPAVSAGLPAVSAGLPAVVSAGLPAVSAALPAVAAGLPVVSAALPDILQAGLPSLMPNGLPAVAGRGVEGFGRVDLPLAREAGLPEVLGAGVSPLLPSVGDSLPALSGEPQPFDSFGGEAASDSAQTADGDPFGGFGADGPDADPFAGSEAEFGAAAAEADPFGAPANAPDADPFGGDVPEPAPSATYGEVEIGGGGTGEAPIETEEMEFSAIPEDETASPGGRAAAHAAVHDGADADAAGSTLELGPERRPARRRRSRRLAIALGVCALAIAGGSLSLEPRLGPFGSHFILDQVHRPEHDRLLSQLIAAGRNGRAADTFDNALAAISQLESAREGAPRYEPLQARAAYAHYEAALRFGPLPKLEAAGKAELDRLSPDSAAVPNRLARAARAALTHSPDAKHQLEELGSDLDARELLGEFALAEHDWATAEKTWRDLAKTDPKSAQNLFGLARAELGSGKAVAARNDGERVLVINPGHVGARILALEAKRAIEDAKASDEAAAGPSTDALVAAIAQALPHASPGEGALAHTVLGELHLAQGRNAPAQQAFEDALGIDDNFPRALIGLGEALDVNGRHAEALARFEAAARLEPESLPAQLGVAKAQIQLTHISEAKTLLATLLTKHPGDPTILYWRARAEQSAADNDSALATYRASIEAGKGRADSVRAYLGLAKLQADLGQLAAAQATLGEARSKLPPSGALNKALGEIEMSRGDYAEAYGHFQQALALDASDTRARFLGAMALTRLGRFDEALAAFQSVSETDKDFPGLSVERGRLFEESGKNDQALREYENAYAHSPDDTEVQTRVGCARVIAGKGKEAEDLLEKLTRTLPRSAEASYCLGRALLEEERLLDAGTRLDRAVELDPTRAIYHLYVGWVASELGHNAKAEAELGRALELDKGLADAYWQRGRLKQKQGAVKDAIRDLERALSLKPSRYEALADLATSYADLGRMSDALKVWEEALARDADNATWHFRYGKLLSSSGNGAMAAAHLRRAIDLVNETIQEKAATSTAPKPKGPPWLWQAHYLLARELGAVAASIPHWQAYLRLAPADDPYRREAERALAGLGQPWDH
jgi:predicted Zn finger-like uncharacterized protein